MICSMAKLMLYECQQKKKQSHVNLTKRSTPCLNVQIWHLYFVELLTYLASKPALLTSVSSGAVGFLIMF